MAVQLAFEILLAAAALVLLGRDLHHAWQDGERRPVTLVTAAAIAMLLVGSAGARPVPSPWWLLLPGAVLAWEAARGWRRTPRSRLWEVGMAAFAAAFLLGAVGFGLGDGASGGVLLAAAAVAGLIGFGLLWQSRRHEPRPWRADDIAHYERRARERAEDKERGS
jgi:hypothetical protein